MTVELLVIAKLKDAFQIMEAASYQSHSGHWDREGTRGRNCPECTRANRLRTEANNIFTAALELLPKGASK